MIFKVNNSYLYYDNTFGTCYSYYETIVNTIRNILITHRNRPINIIFSNKQYDFQNSNKVIRITCNDDHTLVKQGGINTNGAPVGTIQYDKDTNYLVRITNYTELQKADIIIDYSIPNIYNVRESNLFNDFSKKHIYIYPSIYNLDYNKENRNINTLTTFVNTQEPRRRTILEKLKKYSINHTNVNYCFDKKALENIYKNTKVLINVHKTDHHDTLEELRILPALQCGILVISEESPLSQLVPYKDYIIWASYDTILYKVIDVLNRYNHYHDLIFTQEKMIKLNELTPINSTTLESSILKLI